MTLVRQLVVSGTIDRSAFDTALEASIARHPLLHAVIDSRTERRPSWKDARFCKPFVDWDEDGRPLACPADGFIDLTSEIGLRVWIRQSPGSATVTLQIHHVCTDGTGAIQFIADLFSAYAARTSNCDVELAPPPIRTDLLRRRGNLANRAEPLATKQIGWANKLVKIARFLTRTPTMLHPRRSQNLEVDRQISFPGIVSHALGSNELERLKAVAKQDNATLNDLMMRDMFLVIASWNREQQPARPGRWIRITMPLNLRNQEFECMPAANVMSYGFLTRHVHDCDDPQALLSGIVQETHEIKYGGSARIFLKSIESMQRIRGAMQWMTDSGRKCYTTVVFSNVGDVTWRLAGDLPCQDRRLLAGNLVLEAVRGCPPLRRNTNAVFHVMTYAGELTIAARCDRHFFTESDSRELLSRFVAQLRISAQLTDWATENDRPAAQHRMSWGDRVAS